MRNLSGLKIQLFFFVFVFIIASLACILPSLTQMWQITTKKQDKTTVCSERNVARLRMLVAR